MQFINKFKYKRKGHRIIKAFIKDKWNNDIQRYVNLNYNELKRIKAFKYLLLKEQQGFCCYCMRKIPFNEVTLEHVMPHHLEDKKQVHRHPRSHTPMSVYGTASYSARPLESAGLEHRFLLQQHLPLRYSFQLTLLLQMLLHR